MTADHSDLKAKAKREMVELTRVFVYLWLVLSSIALQRKVILEQEGIDMKAFGFAFINALALAKFMLIGVQLKFARRWLKRSLLASTVVESAAFAVVLMILRILEEILVDLYHGKSLMASFPSPVGQEMQEIAMLAVVLFIALLPFFAYLELRDALGEERIREIFLGSRKDVTPR